MNKSVKLTLTIVVVCLVSALTLSYFYVSAKPRIERNKLDIETKVKQEIIPEAEQFISVDGVSSFLSFEEAKDKKGDTIGFLIKNKTRGYGGDIVYLTGITLDKEPRIINLKILEHKETPGLGAKVVEEKFLSQYVGKTVNEVILKKDSLEGKIEAISGATITSRALTNSINQLLKKDIVKEIIEKRLIVSEDKKKEKKVSTKPMIKKETK